MLSVIIPVFNREKEIVDAIASVLALKVSHELIVVDDASTDNSIGKIKSHFKNEIESEKLRLISFEQNRGASAARNAGFKDTKGECVLFLDSDDILNNEGIREACELLQKKPLINIVYGGYRIIRNGKPVRTSQAFEDKYAINGIIRTWVTHPSAIIYRRNYLQGKNLYNEQLRAMQDYDFTLRMFSETEYIKRLRDYFVDVNEVAENRISLSRFDKHGDSINRSFMDSLAYCEIKFGIQKNEEDFRIRLNNIAKNYLAAGNTQNLRDLLSQISSKYPRNNFSIFKIRIAAILPGKISSILLN